MTSSRETNPVSNPSIAVVGAGITGLVAAHRLAKEGRSVTLFEVSEDIGGCIRTRREDGWLIEAGPNSILDNKPELGRLVEELGLGEQLIAAAPEAKNRYLVRDGVLQAVPTSPPGLPCSRFLSFGAKLRLFGDLFVKPGEGRGDESVADFCTRHFGAEVAERVVAAMVAGIYAGDIHKLSMRHAFPELWEMDRRHGSLLRGLKAAAKKRRQLGETRRKPGIVSFRDGLGTLTHALAKDLPSDRIRLGARITGFAGGRPYVLRWECEGRAHQETFDALILAVPARALAALSVGDRADRPLALLDGITYPPLASVFLGYRRDRVAHPLDGFGLLSPPSESLRLMGVLFSSTLFPGRAPEGHVALTVMIGGAVHPEFALGDDAARMDWIRDDLAKLLGVRGDPVFARTHLWPRSIPQYEIGYERFLEAIDAFERAHPGVHVGGNIRGGISSAACVANGERLAATVLAEPGTVK